MPLVCTACQKRLDRPAYIEEVVKDSAWDPVHPICPVCGGLHFEWRHKQPVEFDYYYQVYRDSDGKVVEIDYSAFPCPSCASPAKETSITAYYEAYKCTNPDCRRSFEVK